jgi:DNA-binding NarL/FixJ family response regulator
MAGVESEAQARRALVAARTAQDEGDFRAAERAVAGGLALVVGSRSIVEAELRVEEARLALWRGEGEAPAEAALRLARRAGAPLARALLAAGIASHLAGRTGALKRLRAAAQAAADEGDVAIELEAQQLLAASLQSFGRARAALALMDELVAHTAALGRPRDHALARWVRARYRMYVRGEYDDAIRTFRELLEEPLGLPLEQLRGDLATAFSHVGEHAAAAAVLDDAELSTQTPWVRAFVLFVRSEAELAAGRPERARTVAEEALSFAPPEIAIYAELTRAWATHDLGGTVPSAGDWPAVAPAFRGWEQEVRALQALSSGRYREAATLFASAAEAWAGNFLRDELRARAGLAEALFALGDSEGAEDVVSKAVARARAVGLAAAEAQLTRARHKPPVPVRRDLTDREREVVGLVGRGLSSGDIARELGVTRSTVETHVREAMAKLGARTRVQAALLLEPVRTRTLDELTPTERRILELIAAGATVTDAAHLLHLSRRTVTRRLAEIRRRAGVESLAELLAASSPQHGAD